MKTILFVSMGLGIGGTEKTLVEAVNALDKKKYNVTVYLRNNGDALASKVNNNVQIIKRGEVPKFEKRLYGRFCDFFSSICDCLKIKSGEKFRRSKIKKTLYKRARYENKKFFKNIKYDCAVAYDVSQECANFVDKYVSADKKYAFIHVTDISDAKEEIYTRFEKVVCVNSEVANGIKEHHPAIAGKVTDIENYLDPAWVLDEAKKAKTVVRPNADLVLASCGRCAPIKGFDMAVNAAEILKNRGVDFHWFFVGGGDEETHVNKLIVEQGLGDEITVTGFQNNPFGYMKSCDIYVQPSYEDAHPTTILESVILGKPIISTKTAGGVYFKEKYSCCEVVDISADALAEGIIALFSDKAKMKQMADNSRNTDFAALKKEYVSKINMLFE